MQPFTYCAMVREIVIHYVALIYYIIGSEYSLSHNLTQAEQFIKIKK